MFFYIETWQASMAYCRDSFEHSKTQPCVLRQLLPLLVPGERNYRNLAGHQAGVPRRRLRRPGSAPGEGSSTVIRGGNSLDGVIMGNSLFADSTVPGRGLGLQLSAGPAPLAALSIATPRMFLGGSGLYV